MRSLRTLRCALAALALGACTVGVAFADDWDMYLTVDNQFDVYFGTPTTTTFHAGGGSSWPTEYHFTASGRAPTDYMYVATASDHSVAQGFVGVFTNTTTGATLTTSSSIWEVFPAGRYAATNPYWPSPWPASLMPTQAQVDTAIAYAEANSLWGSPLSAPGYDLDPSTPTAPYTYPWIYTYPNIPSSARWIWHDSGRDTAGFMPPPLQGFNHDEFLVFRIRGEVPEPATLLGLLAAGLALAGRRRA